MKVDKKTLALSHLGCIWLESVGERNRSIPSCRDGMALFLCLVGRIEWFYFCVWRLVGRIGWMDNKSINTVSN
jgi:hypothetical protein